MRNRRPFSLFILLFQLSRIPSFGSSSTDPHFALQQTIQTECDKKYCCSCLSDCLTLKSYLLAHGGARWDKVTCTTGIIFPNNYEMYDDRLSAKDLEIYETGVRALVAFDAHWYARGFYNYGWIVDGNFSDLTISGKQKGNTQDGLAGLGYLNQINDRCALALVGGWAFDEQKTILKKSHLPQFNGLEFQSIWNGPWLGLDFFAGGSSSKIFLFNLGYEFHLTNWRGSWLLDHPLSDAFSDQRKGGMCFGHVAYCDFKWDLSEHWRFDLEFKYQNWSTQSTGFINSSGSVEFDSSPISGPVSAITFLKKASWVSYGASLNVGYSF